MSDEEVEEVVRHLKAFGPPNYMSGVIDGPDEEKADGIDMVLGLGGNADGEDTIYDEAVSIVLRTVNVLQVIYSVNFLLDITKLLG